LARTHRGPRSACRGLSTRPRSADPEIRWPKPRCPEQRAQHRGRGESSGLKPIGGWVGDVHTYTHADKNTKPTAARWLPSIRDSARGHRRTLTVYLSRPLHPLHLASEALPLGCPPGPINLATWGRTPQPQSPAGCSRAADLHLGDDVGARARLLGRVVVCDIRHLVPALGRPGRRWGGSGSAEGEAAIVQGGSRGAAIMSAG